jgi:uncharacterized protein YndB with AHSA1/START domain
MTKAPSIEDRIRIGAPRSAVFKALTDATALGSWMASKAESEPRQGGHFKYVFEFEDATQNNTQEGEYLAVEVDRRVALPWTFSFSPKQTTVEYELDGNGDETDVRFRHSGFETGEPWDSVRERFAGGWHAFLESLKSWVETGAESRPLGIKAGGPGR